MERRSRIRIVVLCDGSWQDRDKVSTVRNGGAYTVPFSSEHDWFTNISLLSQCIKPSGRFVRSVKNKATDKKDETGHIPQIVFYHDGVATTPCSHENTRQGAFGYTHGEVVRTAYTFIADNYQPGDELFFFGFSRGAYIVREIAAFINYAGIMSRAEVGQSLRTIWLAYQRRNPSKPDTVEFSDCTFYNELGRWPSGNAMRTARGNERSVCEAYGHDFPCDGADISPPNKIMYELNAFVLDSAPDKDSKKWQAVPFSKRYPRVEPPPIQVIGVWDTVGGLGVPQIGFLNPAFEKYFSFFDPILEPTVRHAFHALGLHEDRKDFLPQMWYLPKPGVESAADQHRREGQVLKQVWFEGTHCDIGGGLQWHGLSDITLAWMVAQLTDTTTGNGPLLAIDLERLKALQDRRKAWAKQAPHPSRVYFEAQQGRNVLTLDLPKSVRSKVVWKSIAEQSVTNESIHHSVVVGGRYDPKSSRQFLSANRQNPNLIQEMWERAKDPKSLSATEKMLMWTRAEKDATPRVRPDRPLLKLRSKNRSKVDKDSEFCFDYDAGLPPQRPHFYPKAAWTIVERIGWAWPRSVAFIRNGQSTPHDTIKPGKLLRKIGESNARRQKKVEGKQQLAQAKTSTEAS